MITKYDTGEKVILIIILLIGIIALGFWSGELSIERIDGTDEVDKEVTPTDGHSFDDLLDAIEWVESKGDPWAVGDGGNAVGAYQIHKIYVDDVNRIATFRTYSYADRNVKSKSRKMASIFLKHYGGTLEEMARKHNGGPQGHKKKSTEPYWAKVKARMERE